MTTGEERAGLSTYESKRAAPWLSARPRGHYDLHKGPGGSRGTRTCRRGVRTRIFRTCVLSHYGGIAMRRNAFQKNVRGTQIAGFTCAEPHPRLENTGAPACFFRPTRRGARCFLIPWPNSPLRADVNWYPLACVPNVEFLGQRSCLPSWANCASSKRTGNLPLCLMGESQLIFVYWSSVYEMFTYVCGNRELSGVKSFY